MRVKLRHIGTARPESMAKIAITNKIVCSSRRWLDIKRYNPPKNSIPEKR